MNAPHPSPSSLLAAEPAVHELIAAAGRHHPQRTAIEHAGLSLSHAALAEQVARWLDRLAAQVKPGCVVALRAARGVDAIAASLAIWQHGCTLMPIDDAMPAERQRHMLDAVPPAALIHSPRPGEWLIEALAAAAPRHPHEPDHAYIAFTSGSTGLPKAILGSHRGLSHFLRWQGEEFGIAPGDRFAHLTHLSFDVWLRDAFTPLSRGATLCIPEARHLGASDFFDFMRRKRISGVHVVPSVANHWIQHADAAAASADLRLAFFAGEPLEGALVRKWQQRFPACQVVNLYGPTETTLAKHFKRIAPAPADGIQTVGWPLPGASTHILDEQLAPCPDGTLGEICIATEFRSHGYLLAEGLAPPFIDITTAQGLLKGVYRTGDLGLRRPDGEIEIRGRRDDQVKINGVRIELLEVKSGIASLPEVRDVHVCAIGELYQRSLAAVIEADEGVADRILAQLRRRFPAAMVPTRIITRPSLPRLPNGKLNRPELARLAAAAPEASRPTVLPPATGVPRLASEIAPRLEALWKTVLRTDTLDPERNFFDAGGSSMSIVELHALIENTFQTRLPVVRLFEHPTLATQLALLQGGGSAPPAARTAAPGRTSLLRAQAIASRRRAPTSPPPSLAVPSPDISHES